MRSQRLGHQLHVFGQVGIVFHPLADPPEAVLHAVQGIGDLVRDAGHQLPDAQHLLLLPQLGVRPVHIAANRGGKVYGYPQGAGKSREDAQHVQPVGRRKLRRIGGESQRIDGNPLQIQKQHHAADHRRGERGEKVGRRPRKYIPAMIM